ncbi:MULTISPECIES: barstar family protein [Streptomyces]|uniref:barstar family protein n=1 Tax=Streptomyces TaxID=1883 RepID=UPI000CD548C3|nr:MULTISPECIES: barstar family protein [Streptomyces]
MSAPELVVDLRGRHIETLDDFWDAVSGPCGLPTWFGRNLDAWADVIESRGISDEIDGHETLSVHVDGQGLFAGGRRDAELLAGVFDGRRNRLVVHAVGRGRAREGRGPGRAG